MKRYLFISNSNKSGEKRKSREPIHLGNVRQPCIDAAHKMGYEIWLGVNRDNPEELDVETDYPIFLYDSCTYRSLTNIRDNWNAYCNTIRVLKKGNFEVIHCNTPIGGVIGRLCGKRMNIKKVIYTAHGFHFYKGAPLFNRTVLKWAEMLMAHWTDAIITMNKEDYEAAQKFRLRNHGKIFFIPGVGIETEKYKNIEVDKKVFKESLGLKETDIICISMGDLILRKNYSIAIKALAKCANKNLQYLICGKGPEIDNLRRLAKELKVENQVHFLGFRSDIEKLLQISDIFLFTTLQEGMPRSMMEAMASGLPCVASKIRGNIDLIENKRNGYLCDPHNENEFSEALNILCADKKMRKNMGKENLRRIKDYDISIVRKKMNEIYTEILKNEVI